MCFSVSVTLPQNSCETLGNSFPLSGLQFTNCNITVQSDLNSQKKRRGGITQRKWKYG